jgi:hypothetical protein
MMIMMIGWLMNGDWEGNDLGLNDVLPGIYLYRLLETTDNFIQVGWCPGWDSNRVRPS